MCLELYKVINKEKDIEQYKCGFINLALPYFGFGEPLPPKKNKIGEDEWTLWDRIEMDIKEQPTVGAVIESIEKRYPVETQILTYSTTMLWSFFFPPAKQTLRKNQKSVPCLVLASWLRIDCNDVFAGSKK